MKNKIISTLLILVLVSTVFSSVVFAADPSLPSGCTVWDPYSVTKDVTLSVGQTTNFNINPQFIHEIPEITSNYRLFVYKVQPGNVEYGDPFGCGSQVFQCNTNCGTISYDKNDQQVKYTLNDSNCCGGSDTFTIYLTKISGGGGNDPPCIKVTVTLNITCTVNGNGNQPPVAVDDNASTLDNNTCVDVNVTANDYDPDGDPLTLISVTTPSPFGSATITNSTGGIIQFCPQGECGTATFDYNVSDGRGGSDTATVTVTVPCPPQNNPPVAVNDYYSTDQGVTLNVPSIEGVLSNDYDPDNDTLSAIKLTDPLHGNLTLNSDGSFTYIPDPDFCGQDSFTYEAFDGDLSDQATVVIEVLCETPILPQNNPLPPSILYPGVELQRFVIPTQPIPIDGSIAGIIDTGVTVMIAGVEVPVLEISEGSTTIIGQIRNKGFLTQIDAGIRFQDLPQGVSIGIDPQTQKIRAHQTASYLLNINVSPETPKGEYLFTAIAYSRRGTLDRHLVKLIIN